MKKSKAKYTGDSGEIKGELKIVPDFLPSPAELAGKSSKTKITLEVDDDALEFYKAEARKQRAPYQRMMRNLLTHYARAQQAAEIRK